VFWCTFALGANPARELVFLTWANYIDPEIVAEFESQCECKVTQVYYETDDARDGLMLENEGVGYDVVTVNGLMLQRYLRRGWLAPFDDQAVPNLSHLDTKWRTAFDAADDYGVPYFWGTLGIAYRKDLVPAPITSWRDLMQPDAALRGKITMIDSARDLLVAPLKSLGVSLNSTDPDILEQVRRVLLEQKPYVRGYSYLSLTEESALVTGEAVAAMMFSGDALMVKEHDPSIEYVLPEEGGQIWVDYLTVMARSHKQELAAAFINFLNEPQTAARNAEFVFYATPNVAAAEFLPEEFLIDPVIYPDATALQNSEYYTRLPPRVERSYNEIFTRVVE
jgi:spermidine/putrescine transport system substrate-binding protein